MRIPKIARLKIDGINNLYGYTIPKGTLLRYTGSTLDYFGVDNIQRYKSPDGRYFDVHSDNFKTFFDFEEDTFGYKEGLKYV